MPNTCHRCGNVLDDTPAFCPHCGAPQIRVSLPEVETTSPEQENSQAEMQASKTTQGIAWPRAFLAAFIPAFGAIFLLELGAPFAYTFPLWIGLAGYLSVTFYHRRAPEAVINSSVGTRLGAVTGLCCFGLILLRILISLFVQRASGHSIRQDLMNQLQHQMAANPNPDAAKMAQDFLTRPDAFAIIVVISLVVLFVVFLMSATLGGALSGSLQSRRPRQ